jgi:hypothetical protein
MERAFERLEKLNGVKYKQARAEVKAAAAGGSRLPAKVATVKKRDSVKSPQVVEFKKVGA